MATTSRAGRRTEGGCRRLLMARREFSRIGLPQEAAVEISITLPDDVAHQLGAHWRDLPRRALEAFVAEAYEEAAITGLQAQEILGLRSRLELDTFLKRRGVFLDYDEEDLDADIRALNGLLEA
jgi:predicted HTH domain antitoxin